MLEHEPPLYFKVGELQPIFMQSICRFLNESPLLLFFPLLGLLILTVSLVCLYASLNKRKKLMEMQNKQYEQLIEYTGVIESLYENMRNQKHDFLNILFSIKGYVEGGQWEEFHCFYHAILKEYMDAKPRNALSALNRIRHPGLKGILGYKLNHAISLGVAVHLYIFTQIEFRDTAPLDLCRVIGILTDNAIEAACDSQEKEIHIVMESDTASTMFIISNTYRIKPDLSQLERKGYTTKGPERGIGLHNVRQILARNPSMALKTALENNLFFQELVISL